MVMISIKKTGPIHLVEPAQNMDLALAHTNLIEIDENYA